MADNTETRDALPGSAAELAGMVDPSALGDHLAFLVFLKQVRERRESRGLSIVEVARRMGVDHAAVSRLESGKQPNPTVNTVMRYVEAVGLRIGWSLAERDDEPPIPRGGERERRRIRSSRPAGTGSSP